eukprot:5906549-Heterocapsa_arctica.AAC.1
MTGVSDFPGGDGCATLRAGGRDAVVSLGEPYGQCAQQLVSRPMEVAAIRPLAGGSTAIMCVDQLHKPLDD